MDQVLAGTRLSIDTPRASGIEIMPDPALHGQVVVHANADRPHELDQILLEGGGTARIGSRLSEHWHIGDTNWHFSLGDTPTLTLRVRVPAGTSIAIDESGNGHYTIGPVGGSLALDLSGAGHVTAAQVRELDIDLSGNGTVSVGQAAGAANVRISGHGDVTIEHGALPSLSADLSGVGTVAVTAGRIERVELDESGLGAIRIGADVGDAQVDISGAGSVHFAKVTGAVEKDVSGAGEVTVGN